ncbi:hypothetical protein SHKM778_11350 [Streptomyces sp. KM77-8]|uniref:Uncharacterized protein n=1 Tax=Streptomyces haneummycinicus TaxID=3074435 RepID=A0AAT9HBH7_9ACTN
MRVALDGGAAGRPVSVLGRTTGDGAGADGGWARGAVWRVVTGRGRTGGVVVAGVGRGGAGVTTGVGRGVCAVGVGWCGVAGRAGVLVGVSVCGAEAAGAAVQRAATTGRRVPVRDVAGVSRPRGRGC